MVERWSQDSTSINSFTSFTHTRIEFSYKQKQISNLEICVSSHFNEKKIDEFNCDEYIG